MTRMISIDPVTRLEGHARVDLFLADDGSLSDCYLVMPEIRGFEKFLEGRPVEECPRITSRICGVCPEAHLAAAAKAVDAVYQVQLPVAAELSRRLQYNAFVAGDHATHFFALGGPDFILGPDAPPAERNLFGVIAKVGRELAGKVIGMRKAGHEVSQLLGGRRIHPVNMLPGGQSKPVTAAMATRLAELGDYMVEFSMLTQQLFADIVLGNPAYVDLITSESFTHRTYYMSLVDDDNLVDHYDGHIRVVDPEGVEVARYAAGEYLDHVAEHVETWSYLKFAYLKQIGWQGLVDGVGSGVYRSAPLAMLNAADGMQTPLAQDEYDKFYETLGGKPVHHTLAYHWARIIEMLQCAELVQQIARDERLVDTVSRVVPTATPHEGVGVVEAPRGMLTHHYVTDDNGIVQRANLIVGTANNYAPLFLSVKKAAAGLIQAGKEIDEPLLNTIEMAFRAYDPCIGCATHAAPGKLPLVVTMHDSVGETIRVLRRGV